jgi:hypothetical protein
MVVHVYAYQHHLVALRLVIVSVVLPLVFADSRHCVQGAWRPQLRT